jgi:hypothetical protein
MRGRDSRRICSVVVNRVSHITLKKLDRGSKLRAEIQVVSKWQDDWKAKLLWGLVLLLGLEGLLH